MTHDVAVIPGDGIGPEVADAVRPLMADAADEFGFDLSFTHFDWGIEHYIEHDEMMSDDSTDELAEHDAILLDAGGHPDVPDHVPSGG